MGVYVFDRKKQLELFRYAFEAGRKRKSSTLPDKILNELLEEWVDKNLANKGKYE